VTRKRKSEQRLDELYESIPVSIECKGLCQESCGPIAMTQVEFRRIVERTGIEPTIDDHGTCSLLVGGKCSIYDIRPTICRLWGISERMPCVFGCKPNPRYLTDEEGKQILRKADKVTGKKSERSTLPELEKFLNEQTGR
jgi:hypothetical protein